jgi:hypothetical protein
MTLAYTPIDIAIELPDEQFILDWFEQHKVVDTDYWEYQANRHTWAIVACTKNLDNWRKIDFSLWENRRDSVPDPSLFFHPGFIEAFPSLAEAIKKLPFKQLTYAGMILQMGEIGSHQDTYDHNDPSEPRRYNIYLTDPEYNTFYMCKEENSERAKPKFDDTYRCFAFNNSECWHGAEPTNRPKIMIATTGIVDNEAHKELIARSVEKFKDKVLYL